MNRYYVPGFYLGRHMECIVRDDAALTPHNPVDLTGQAWSMHSKSWSNHPKLRHHPLLVSFQVTWLHSTFAKIDFIKNMSRWPVK